MAFTCCACMLFCIVHLRVAIRMFKHMSNSISCSFPKWDLWMAAALVCVAVVLGIYPADRTVWCVEMVWAVGLWAILLLLTRRKFRFSTPAYLCFFVWTVLQIVGAHYTFEHVPMEWHLQPMVDRRVDRLLRAEADAVSCSQVKGLFYEKAKKETEGKMREEV